MQEKPAAAVYFVQKNGTLAKRAGIRYNDDKCRKTFRRAALRLSAAGWLRRHIMGIARMRFKIIRCARIMIIAKSRRNTMGKLFVISGPSGAGLREIVGAVLDARSDLGHVVPVTARKKKAGEVDGEGFWFYDLEGWNAMKESGELLECTEFAGNDYGTSRRLVQEQLDAGKNVVLNLEIDRAAQLKARMPEAVCVYMEPSSEDILRARYEKTARSPFEVTARMDRAAQEKRAAAFCDCVICTDDAAGAARALNELIDRG